MLSALGCQRSCLRASQARYLQKQLNTVSQHPARKGQPHHGVRSQTAAPAHSPGQELHTAPGWSEIRGARHREAWSSLSCRRVGCKSKTSAPSAPNFFKGRAKPFLTSAHRPQTAKGDISQSYLSFTLLAFSLVTTCWRRKLGRPSGPAQSPAGPAGEREARMLRVVRGHAASKPQQAHP